jgi:hypothetical protein
MTILGVLCIIAGLLFGWGLLVTIGIILVIVGLVLYVMGRTRPIGGRAHWF